MDYAEFWKWSSQLSGIKPASAKTPTTGDLSILRQSHLGTPVVMHGERRERMAQSRAAERRLVRRK
jgi:hypothetical protein